MTHMEYITVFFRYIYIHIFTLNSTRDITSFCGERTCDIPSVDKRMPTQQVGGYYAAAVLDVVRMEAVRHVFVSDVPLFCMRPWFGYGNASSDRITETSSSRTWIRRGATQQPLLPEATNPTNGDCATSCTPNQRCDNMHPLRWYLRKLAADSILHEKLHFSLRTLRLARLSHEYAKNNPHHGETTPSAGLRRGGRAIHRCWRNWSWLLEVPT